MVNIVIKNNKSQLLCDRKLLHKMRNKMAIKAKNYFWCSPEVKRRWDGMIRYITETGTFETGLLDQICFHLQTMKRKNGKVGYKYQIIDEREKFKPIHEVDELGGLELRKRQKRTMKAFFKHTVEGILFPRGLLNEATNSGKSLIAAAIFASYSSKRRGVFLVNSKTLFNQSIQDFIKLLGKDEVGWVSSEKGVKWKRINICMVQTLGSRLKSDPSIRNNLVKQDIVIVDEQDELIGRKDCKAVLSQTFNAYIRIGLSGSSLKSKDKNRNQEQLKFFGPVIHSTTNRELVDEKVSTPPDITFIYGCTKPDRKGDYKTEYEKGIIKNKKRHRIIWKVIERAMRKNRLPAVILFKIHDHGRRILEMCPPELLDKLRIKLIHHKTTNREGILKQFNNGKVDVLLASMIIKRGKNIPLAKLGINAAAGDSEATVLQILGRFLRKDKSKKKVWMVDFYDEGYYLRRHSKRRMRYFKSQQFPVRETYKKYLPKRTIK